MHIIILTTNIIIKGKEYFVKQKYKTGNSFSVLTIYKGYTLAN